MMNVHSGGVGFPPPQGSSGQYNQTESPRGRLGDPRQFEYPPLDVPFTNQSAFSSQFTPQGFCYDSPFVYSDPPPMNYDSRGQQPLANQSRPDQSFFDAQQVVYPASSSQPSAQTVGLAPHLAQPRAQASGHATSEQDYSLTWMGPPPVQDIYRKEEKPNEIPFVYPATTLQTGDRFSQLLEAKLGVNRPGPASEPRYSPPRATYNTHIADPPAQPLSFPSDNSQANAQRVGIPGPAYHDTLAIETALHDYQQVTISPDDVAPVIPSRYFGWTSRPQPEYQHTPQPFSPVYEPPHMPSTQHYDHSSNGFASHVPKGFSTSAHAASVNSGSFPGTPQMSPIALLATPTPVATEAVIPPATMLQTTSDTKMQPPPYWYSGPSSAASHAVPAPPIASGSRQLPPPPLPPLTFSRTSPPLPGTHSRLSALSPMKTSPGSEAPNTAFLTNTSMPPPSTSLESTPMAMSASLPPLPNQDPWSQEGLSIPPSSSTAWTSSPPKARSSASPPLPSRISEPRLPAAGDLGATESKKRKAVDHEVAPHKQARSAAASASQGDGERKQVIACYHCREKKLKCDGGKPRCGNCCRRGEASCAYDVTLKRRGPGKNNKKDRRRRATLNAETKQEKSVQVPSLSVAVQSSGGEGSRLGSRFETSTTRGA